MNEQGKRRKAEGGIFSQYSRYARISFSLPPSAFRLGSPLRLGTTLIELLITITIITILSATFLGVSNLAMENAREARTKTTIGKIHGLLMEKWNSYATRRVDIDTSAITSSTSKNRGRLIALARLDATRVMIRQEMPDRWSDLLNNTVASRVPGVSTLPAPLTVSRSISAGNSYNMALTYPALARTYLRRYNSIPFATMPGTTEEKVAQIENNQGAECLYLVIMLSTGDGEARSLFSEQDIGDTDGDGAPEFLDGWGRPIHFLRWPSGFAEAGLSALMPADADTDHDPFDPFRLDNPTAGFNRGYRLVPLIYSGGPDGDPDLYTAKGPMVNDPYNEFASLIAPVITARVGTPMNPKALPFGIGAVDDNDGDNWLDNIHNHLQDNK